MSSGPDDERYERGMRARREVLGDAHVDAAVARTTDFTADFQELITRYAWGDIWGRPGLDRRTRSCITLTALVARRPRRRARAAPARGPPQRPDGTRSRRCSCRPALLRRARRQRRVRDRPGGARRRKAPRDPRRDPVGGAHADRPLRRRAGAGAARRPRRDRGPGGGRAGRRRPGRDRGRLPRLRQPGRRGQPRRRPHGRAARRPAAVGRRRDAQPAVRLGPRGDLRGLPRRRSPATATCSWPAASSR